MAVNISTNDMDNWVVPFRGYLKQNSSSGAPERTKGGLWEYIPFSPDADSYEEAMESVEGSVRIDVLEDAVLIVSTLEKETTITIFTVAGTPVGSYSIAPHSEVVVPLPDKGIYIVNRKKVII